MRCALFANRVGERSVKVLSHGLFTLLLSRSFVLYCWWGVPHCCIVRLEW